MFPAVYLVERTATATEKTQQKKGFPALQAMVEPLELKKTLNLPKTDFPMKASLPENEPKQLETLHTHNLSRGNGEAGLHSSLFLRLDGPPYPIGEIHLG